MSPESKLKEGQLDEALRLLTVEVRNNPADAKRRVFLFQLLALLGQWERARNQLKVCSELDVKNLMMVSAYTEVLKGEVLRSRVFEGRRSPMIIGEPQQWLALLVQALKLAGEGQYTQAAPLREQAFEQAEAVAGEIDGVPFEWIADADPRIGPCLEVIVEGGYSWIPFSRLKSLKFEPPTDLRDKIWAPVQITYANEGQVVGFVPVRYAGTERSSDAELLLSRKTDWQAVDEDLSIALGQKMFATNEGEYPLLDVRQINFGTA